VSPVTRELHRHSSDFEVWRLLCRAGLTIRLLLDGANLAATFTATMYPLCGVGSYSEDGTGSPPCLACPPGRYGSTLGLNSSACSGPCSALPRSSREALGTGGLAFVCSQGATSAQGVPSVIYPNQGYMKRSVTLDPQAIISGQVGANVAVARVDSDPYADLVNGQLWYKSDGLSPPSFSARSFCQHGPAGNVTFPAYIRVRTVDSKL
jgi:hypothetical protein